MKEILKLSLHVPGFYWQNKHIFPMKPMDLIYKRDIYKDLERMSILFAVGGPTSYVGGVWGSTSRSVRNVKGSLASWCSEMTQKSHVLTTSVYTRTTSFFSICVHGHCNVIYSHLCKSRPSSLAKNHKLLTSIHISTLPGGLQVSFNVDLNLFALDLTTFWHCT